MTPEYMSPIISLIAFVFTVAGVMWAVKADTKALKIQVQDMAKLMQGVQDEMAELRKVLITLADHAGRMNLIDERLMMQGRRVDAIGNKVEQILLGGNT